MSYPLGQGIHQVREVVVDLREAKASRAKAGTRVVITSHGIPIADLVPHGTGVEPKQFLKRPGPLPKLMKLAGWGPSASDLVLGDRQD